MGFFGKTPRKKRRRYKIEAIEIARRSGLALDTSNWEQIWDLLDAQSGPEQKTARPTYLYAVVDITARAVKLGKSKQLNKRLRALQTSNPHELKLWAYCRHESPFTEEEAHEKFKDFHMSGEWFRLTEQTREFINAMRNRAGL